jgi:hypothetical protein
VGACRQACLHPYQLLTANRGEASPTPRPAAAEEKKHDAPITPSHHQSSCFISVTVREVHDDQKLAHLLLHTGLVARRTNPAWQQWIRPWSYGLASNTQVRQQHNPPNPLRWQRKARRRKARAGAPVAWQGQRQHDERRGASAPANFRS